MAEKGEYFPSINNIGRGREIFGVFGAPDDSFCRLILGLFCPVILPRAVASDRGEEKAFFAKRKRRKGDAGLAVGEWILGLT